VQCAKENGTLCTYRFAPSAAAFASRKVRQGRGVELGCNHSTRCDPCVLGVRKNNHRPTPGIQIPTDLATGPHAKSAMAATAWTHLLSSAPFASFV
jgi:hypothetical protein